MFSKTKIWTSFNNTKCNIKALYGDTVLGIIIDKTSHNIGYFVNNIPVKRGTAKQIKFMVQYIEMAKIGFKTFV